RMDHDDDIGAAFERGGVTRLLIAAVAPIFLVNFHVQSETAGHGDRLVVALIVDQDAVVHQLGQFADGGLERLLGVVGREDDYDSLSVDHGAPPDISLLLRGGAALFEAVQRPVTAPSEAEDTSAQYLAKTPVLYRAAG